MFRILVPYDGSEASERALQEAAKLAKSLNLLGPQVLILHVVAEFPNYHFIDRPSRSINTGEKITVSEYLREINALMKQSATEALTAKANEIRNNYEFEIRTAIISGNIVDKILEIADKERWDLIVIGNIGRSGMSRIKTLGSVSRGVSERAQCPVMIVH